MNYVGELSRDITLGRVLLWWCLLLCGVCCLLFVVTPGARASIIRRRGYIPADGAPVANYVGELSRGIA